MNPSHFWGVSSFHPCNPDTLFLRSIPLGLILLWLQLSGVQWAHRLQHHHQWHSAGRHLPSHNTVLLNRQMQPRPDQWRPLYQDDPHCHHWCSHPSLCVGKHAVTHRMAINTHQQQQQQDRHATCASMWNQFDFSVWTSNTCFWSAGVQGETKGSYSNDVLVLSKHFLMQRVLNMGWMTTNTHIIILIYQATTLCLIA